MNKIILTILASITILSATEKPTLTIYTYDAFAASWGAAPKIKKAFEKECKCNLKFVGASSSIGALRKIQLEGKRTKADILLGLDTSIAQIAKETDLFALHGLDDVNLSLPISYKDDTFLPFDYSYIAFIYDSSKLKNPPASFEELADGKNTYKIVIQDPRSSIAGLGLLLWVKQVYGDGAVKYWERLRPKILTITKGWSEAYNLFLKGEADMVLSYTTSPAYHIIDENKTQYKSANFPDGHYGQVEVAGMLKSCKDKELARKFLKFMLSAEFQDIIPTGNWGYPVTKTKKGLPKGFETLYVPSKMYLMDGSYKRKRKIYIDEWLRAVR